MAEPDSQDNTKLLDAQGASPQGHLLALLSAPDTALGAAFPMPRIGGEPPREFRAFRWGTNPTTKGPLQLTPEGAQKLMDEYRSRGHVLCFDYYHSSYNPMVAPAERKAAGQFRLELKSDGLWFTDIQWTDAAAKAITAGEWPFISPAIVHSKDGVIVACRNAGLVTDPGTIGAVPTVLDASAPTDSPPKKVLKMADKKRMVLDAYSAAETTMRRCQALADTDNGEAELGNRLTGHMAPAMDMLRAHMSSAGYMDGAAMASKSSAARDKLMSTLSAELGEEDPEKLTGKLLAKLHGNSPAPTVEGVLLSDEDAALATKMLLDGYRAKYPTTKRASIEAMGLPGVMTYLSAASDIVPMGSAPREVAPIAPTSANVERTMKDKPLPAGMPGGKPTTLSACTPQQRIQVESQLSAARMFMGAAFNEAVELDHALAALSDTDELPRGNEIRHLPYGVDHGTGRITTLSETV